MDISIQIKAYVGCVKNMSLMYRGGVCTRSGPKELNEHREHNM